MNAIHNAVLQRIFLTCTIVLACATGGIAQQPAAAANAYTGADSLDVTQRIVLIGDAGQFVRGEAPVMRAARRFVPFDTSTTVIFLGDNIYRHGLPDDQTSEYEHYRSVIDSQAFVADGTPAKVYFIPGNHDWVNGQPDGLEAVRRQQRYVDGVRPGKVSFQPKDGCPGPVEVAIGKDIVLVVMDSQWWIHKHDKPGIESDCDTKTETEIVEQIQEIAQANDKKLLIFACHHPFRSAGYHGGYYGVMQYFFPLRDLSKNLWIPLPGLGAIYPITRGVFGTPQDLKHPLYANMINKVEDAVRKHPHPIFVHGHEHTLQYFSDTQAAFIVSGSGCKENRIEGRAATGLGGGDQASIEISVDTEPRIVDVHPELQTALDANSTARVAFDALSNSKKKLHTLPVAEAKTDETRARRIAKSIDRLSS